MRAFSMNMPFAALVAHGYKTIEVRVRVRLGLGLGLRVTLTLALTLALTLPVTLTRTKSRNGTMFTELAGETVLLHVGQRTYPDGGKHVEIMVRG